MTLSGGFSLTPPPPASPPSLISYLLVGGGGGGGAGSAALAPGGGGGGGQVLNANLSGLSLGTTVTVTVGAGGTNGLADGTTGTAGANSSIATSGTISALPGQYGINFADGSSAGANPWGGTSGSGNQGGIGTYNNAGGSSGGGNATVGYAYNAASPNGAGGGWGTLVSAFDMYGTDVNNISTFTLSGVVITGAAGQFSCIYSSSVLSVGMAVTILGTYGGTGSITGYTSPTTYYIIATNGTSTFTLSATLGGSAITTTAGTPTGLTYTIASTSTKGYFGGGGGGGMWWAYGYMGLGGRGGGGRGGDGSGVKLSGVVITGTAGQFSFTTVDQPAYGGVALSVGAEVLVAGTFSGTGSITGYTSPTTYYIIATNGTSTFTLSATLGGSAITTTAGTTTGIYTWRVQEPTPTYLGLSGFLNTGGGGGGGGAGHNGRRLPSPGGTGGSGVVIIRYADTYAAASATTGSPTVTTSNGYRYYAFTSSGSLTI